MSKLKIKVVVSDFDGTLLRNDNTVSKKTVDTIKEFMLRGGTFLVATGRMHRSIINRFADLGLVGLDLPVISYQGGLVKTADSDKLLLNRPISKQDAMEVMEYLGEVERVYYHTYLNDNLYVGQEMEWTKLYAQASGVSYTEVGDLPEWIRSKGYDSGAEVRGLDVCHKIMSLMEPDKLKAVMARCNERFCGRVQFNCSSPYLMEAVDINAGKDKAIEYLIEPQGLTLDSVLTIGDSLNDYTMVKRAGFGIAMGNAVPELKAVAKKITLTNDEDGVAAAIEQYCF